MTIEEFNQLPERYRATLLLQQGVVVANRILSELKVYLYQVGKFYVEVYVNTAHKMVQGMHCFDDTQQLDPYLQLIPLPDLSQL